MDYDKYQEEKDFLWIFCCCDGLSWMVERSLFLSFTISTITFVCIFHQPLKTLSARLSASFLLCHSLSYIMNGWKNSSIHQIIALWLWQELNARSFYNFCHSLSDDAYGYIDVSDCNERSCASGWKLLHDFKVTTMSSRHARQSHKTDCFFNQSSLIKSNEWLRKRISGKSWLESKFSSPSSSLLGKTNFTTKLLVTNFHYLKYL